MAKSFPNTGATVIDSAADLPTASAALEGILMFQKDTNELKICDGASWVSVSDTNNVGGLADASYNILRNVVHVTNTTAASDSSWVSAVEATITPTSSSSKILVISTGFFGITSITTDFQTRLVRNSTAIGGLAGTNVVANIYTGANYPSSSYLGDQFSNIYLDSPATTSAVTYKFQGRLTTATLRVNYRNSDSGASAASQMTLLEIMV